MLDPVTFAEVVVGDLFEAVRAQYWPVSRVGDVNVEVLEAAHAGGVVIDVRAVEFVEEVFAGVEVLDDIAAEQCPIGRVVQRDAAGAALWPGR